MAFDYGCFISYPHDDGALVKTFIHDFTVGLKAHLYNLEDGKKYWWDQEQLGVGIRHPQAIASGMCKSACWIMIYYPKYRRSPFCKSEYLAMRELEARRREALGRRLPREFTMILPVLFRGEERDLPGGLSDEMIFEDFSKYTVSGPRILEHPEFEQKMMKISEHVWNVWKTCEDLDHEPRNCDDYTLPEPTDEGWGSESGGPSQKQPR
jgi:hypothetical protein